MRKTALVSTEHSKTLMKWLSKATKTLGHRVAENTYVVGGAVRNFKMSLPVKDVDLVLDSITLGQNSEWLAERLAKLIPAATRTVSDQYGVAKIFVDSEWVVDGLDLSEFSSDGGAAIEIVDARSETYSDDSGGGYKPAITKSTIHDDIYRRDFTFNTLMWRLSDLADGPDKAEIIDITGCGLKDLELGEARCPLNPEKTFYDDPTRIIRAVKFLAKYGLVIPSDTVAAIRKTKWALKKVPYNRLYAEIKGILSEKTWEKVLDSFSDLGLIEVFAEIAEENEPFRASLSTEARKLPYMFFIRMMDLGLSVRHDLSFLPRSDLARLEQLAPTLTREEQDDLVQALRTPGSALKDKSFIPSLAASLGLKGKALSEYMSGLMPKLRELYLANPDLLQDTNKLKSIVRNIKTGSVMSRTPNVRTASQRVAARYLYLIQKA